ncbi:ABC transporter ATP-binding protein [Fulvivirga sp. M361]|uniref:ABC transporter ATP-binding protein n=1 Tax=Fulvivirga sp. M361 TaxID=2594266 RepID=UPI00117B9B99|nr:ABC transporter ATP-binding protein [Fulvivirga sp. M361]TRX50213.1 ABC transporter ATP-binding protein [Fulvivirga sp. M361]
MSKTVIQVENLGKLYRLGEVGTGTISHDLNRWWAQLRGKEDPFSKVGTVNDRTQKAEKGEHVWALKDVSFNVGQGEVLGVIGKNGAGKSTLLKLLSRVTSPTTGHIRIKGRVASLLEVGTGFHPEMTGRENIYMNGTILGMTRKEISAKLDDIVDFAGVAKYLDTPTKRYSSGMQVRLAFAVAAFLEPEILIVDEVLAVGDAEFQKRAIGKMQEVSQGDGRTVLFVSHNMASVSQICSTGLLIENGMMAMLDDVKTVINTYTNKRREVFEGFEYSGPIMDSFIQRFSLCNTAGEEKYEFQFDEPIILKYEMILRNYSKGLNLGLYIQDKHNQRITSIVKELPAPNDDSGCLSIELHLSKQKFLNGSYSISTEIFIPFVDKVHLLKDVLSFEVVDNISPLSRFNNYDMGNFYLEPEFIFK